MRAVLYRGTGCNKIFMQKIARILRKYGGFTRIDQRCWSKFKNSFNYIDTKGYNVAKGSWDLAIGHSAGGFLLVPTRAKLKVAINPFISEYPRVDMVLHAKDDWLVPPDLFGLDNVIVYPGDHGTVPTSELNQILQDMFPKKK